MPIMTLGVFGDCLSLEASCELLMDGDKVVNVHFEQATSLQKDLIINEVGYPLALSDSVWIEIYNASDKTLNLKDYVLYSFAGGGSSPTPPRHDLLFPHRPPPRRR
ncbi:MAG: hypothetical protein R2880_02045 [Deinococcales bacterium]